MNDRVRCSWCDRPFRPRQDGGQQQKFCRPSCRRAFHAALRAWALDAVGDGALTITDIKNGLNATRALLSETEAPFPMVRCSAIVLSLEILPNAVEELRRLGWLDDAGHSSNSAVADAVVGLVERALALRLRPL